MFDYEVAVGGVLTLVKLPLSLVWTTNGDLIGLLTSLCLPRIHPPHGSNGDLFKS